MQTTEKDRTLFSKNLKYYIDISGKDQKQICNELGIPESTFSGYATGRFMPRYKTIEKIADYFGVKMSDLVLEEEKKAPTEQIKLIAATWEQNFSGVLFTTEELKEIFDFAKYVLTKRRE